MSKYYYENSLMFIVLSVPSQFVEHTFREILRSCASQEGMGLGNQAA